MAVNDVVSDYETNVGDNGRESIRPASGDTWLITHIVMDYGGSGWQLTPQANTNEMAIGYWGGNTSVTNNLKEAVGLHPVKILVTNTEYIRLRNYSGSAGHFGFSAIKIEE